MNPLALASLWTRWRALAIGAGVLLLAALCIDTLHALSRELSYAAMLEAMHATPSHDVLAALLATAVSFLALAGYDASALRLAGVRLGWRSVLQTSFVAYALGNAMGVGVLTGGAVRMRMYGAAGVEAGAISQVIAFNMLAFGWGVATMAAVGVMAGADDVARAVHLPVSVLQLGAGAVLAAGIALCVWLGGGRQMNVAGRVITLPGTRSALRVLLISAVDIAASAAVLWMLLPSTIEVDFLPFLGCYAVATALGVLSHVPGGLGVFEALMFVGLRGTVDAEALAGALLLYRLVYYVLPLALALGLLAVSECRRGRATPMLRALTGVAPLLLTAYTLFIGVMLLVSGATPATDEAAALLAQALPLPLVEASHFLGSIAGLGLLFVARGMLLKLDAAWWAGLALAVASLVLALPKGIAWSEALLIGVLVVALIFSRDSFTRRASLLSQAFTSRWLLAICTVAITVTGLLWFVYRDVAYSHELWWQFEFDGHAPRSLRAMLAVDLIALLAASRRLLRTRPPPLQLPDATALERAGRVIDGQDEADACLALMGDKHLLFAPDDRAFLMFGIHGRSWISLFDPVGPAHAWPDLIWQFIERAREAGGRASFYQVRPANLAPYLDAGLRIFKLGEYAQVPLADFSLQGKARGKLRSGLHRAEREGLRFAILPPDEVPAHLPALRAISDAWLAGHATAEKRFSLGAFDAAYVCRLPVAVVSQGDRAVAFATLLRTATRATASVDLMRQLPGAPSGTMDFLFLKLMLHFQHEGYASFGLGMAPLSGMATHALAPNWHRLGRLLYAHGEHFYNFRGLRAFKDKFDPEWEPRYLACPGGVVPLLVLADVAALISGGVKRVIAK